MASTTPSMATAVDLPACRQQFKSSRSCPPSSTSICQGSGCSPRFVITSAADGLARFCETAFSLIFILPFFFFPLCVSLCPLRLFFFLQIIQRSRRRKFRAQRLKPRFQIRRLGFGRNRLRQFLSLQQPITDLFPANPNPRRADFHIFLGPVDRSYR